MGNQEAGFLALLFALLKGLLQLIQKDRAIEQSGQRIKLGQKAQTLLAMLLFIDHTDDPVDPLGTACSVSKPASTFFHPEPQLVFKPQRRKTIDAFKRHSLTVIAFARAEDSPVA